MTQKQQMVLNKIKDDTGTRFAGYYLDNGILVVSIYDRSISLYESKPIVFRHFYDHEGILILTKYHDNH